jgi:hypothetical protein
VPHAESIIMSAVAADIFITMACFIMLFPSLLLKLSMICQLLKEEEVHFVYRKARF